MSDEHTRGRSVESLKKEAKRWLRLLKQNVAEARARFEHALANAPHEPTLRDVQLALAREHGFSGWTELTSAIGKPRLGDISMQRFEEAAHALYEAYNQGTPEAMERHYRHTWHRRAWQGMRTYVQLDLGKRPGDDVEITPDEARSLVAMENGFGSWTALEEFVSTASTRAGLAVRPVSASKQGSDTQVHSREWAEIIRFLEATDSAELDAHGQMTDDALHDISRLSTITSLKLNGSKRLTDDGIRHLARMPQLRVVDLSGTQLTDAGMAAMRELPNLEKLSVGMTRVTDEGLKHLEACERLQEVALFWTHTGDGVFRALAGKPDVCRVQSGNGVTNDGLRLIHNLPRFKTWHGGEVVMGLTSYESAPNQLVLNGSFNDDGMMHLRGLDGLFGLNVDNSALALTARALEPLVDLPNLGWLACDAKDDWMPLIARMPALRFLGAQDTSAGDEGFVALSKSQSIEIIWGRRCHNLRHRGFVALSTMPALRSLSVSCLNVDDAGIATLPNFPALRELMPMDIPDEGYRHIAKCTDLEHLVLMYCRDTTDAATEHLVSMRKLKRYFNSYTTITDRTPQLLSTIDSLETVCFSACHFVTDAGVAALARLPNLREVDVTGRKLTSAARSAFSPRVKVKVGDGL